MNCIKLDKRLLEILQHTVGVDEFARGPMYRNHFCAGGRDESLCRELVNLGYMEEYPERTFVPYPTFGVTELGKDAIRVCSPEPPKVTRSQRRYIAFLNADSGLNFIEWLRLYGGKAA